MAIKAKKKGQKKAVKPDAATIKAMKDKLKRNLEKAKTNFIIAENHLDSARAELECRQEFFDDADSDLWDAESDLEEFNDLLQYAKEYDDWKDVLNFKMSF